MLSVVLFGSMLVLFILNFPIAFGIGLAAATALLTMPNVSLEVVVQRMFHGLNSFVILSAPLFLLLGELMEAAKITDRLIEFAQALVGRLRGGLGHVAIVTNMIMAGISGSGTADAAATGAVLVPTMVKSGYAVPFSAALIGAAATIGPIIPPSIIMVVYASIANVSVGRMFLGGVVPGILMGFFLMAMTAAMARRLNLPAGSRTSLGHVARATRQASLVIITPLIVIVGIVGGVFTATESAGVACVYALILGLGIYRTVSLKDLPGIFNRAVLTTGKVMFVVATASIFSWILARGQVPAQIARLPFFNENAKPWLILFALNILLMILGCLMESIAILIILTPMIMPIAAQAGIDPVHLGVVMSLNLSIGLITPPFGTIMFVLCGVSRCSIPEFSLAAWKFIVALIIVLALTTYIPPLVLFLPNLLMGTG
jgi:tripartite ATP-independent transporter DctM subunit